MFSELTSLEIMAGYDNNAQNGQNHFDNFI